MEKKAIRNILDEPVPELPLEPPIQPVPYTVREKSISYEKKLERRIRKQKRKYEELQEELFNLKKAKLDVKEEITIEHKGSLEGQINEFVYKKNEGDTQRAV